MYVSSGTPNVATPKTSDGSEALNGKKTAMGQQERRSPNLVSVGRPKAAVWIGSAFCAALGLAALVLAALGPGERGTIAALQVTARFSFLLFWLAYTGGAMTALFGSAFEPFKKRAREFGLAFASAHLLHIALVAWLTHIGNAPPRGVFVFFGVAVLWTYLLALFSIARLQRTLGSKGWWLLRVVGLNYIACAFATDFLGYPQFGSIKYLVGYLPLPFFLSPGHCFVLPRSCDALHSCRQILQDESARPPTEAARSRNSFLSADLSGPG
jgi:hypothetical protein